MDHIAELAASFMEVVDSLDTKILILKALHIEMTVKVFDSSKVIKVGEAQADWVEEFSIHKALLDYSKMILVTRKPSS